MGIAQTLRGLGLCATIVTVAPFLTLQVNGQERLTFTSLSPAGSVNSKFFNAWATRVYKASNGAIRIVVRDGTALANFGNVYNRVVTDAVQIGWAIHQVVAGKFPRSEVAGLPFVSSGGKAASLALWHLHKEGLLKAEYKDVVPIAFAVFGPAQIHFRRAPKSITTLSTIKVGVQGRVPSQIISALGGTPISLRSGNIYEALQRRTIDAAIASWAAFPPYKLQEVTTYHLEGPFGQATSMFFMARKRYEALPAAARKAIDQIADESTTSYFSAFFTGQWQASRKNVVADPKHKITALTNDVRDEWSERAKPLIEAWTKAVPGRKEVLARYLELYDAARKQSR